MADLEQSLQHLPKNINSLAVDQPIFDINILKDSVFIMIVGAGFNTMGSYVSSQDIVQRFTTTTDRKKLNKMMLTNGALSIFIATVFYLIGTRTLCILSAEYILRQQRRIRSSHLTLHLSFR